MNLLSVDKHSTVLLSRLYSQLAAR